MSNYYQIAIVGASGKGKTDAARDLNKQTTAFINIENKPLPFKGVFEHTYRPSTSAEVIANIVEAGKNTKINTLFIDSFSAFCDLVLTEARAKFKGFDIWNYYNDEIAKFLNLIKKVPKDLFVTAHYETLGVEGSLEKRIKVKAKEWEGLVEKEFTVVLYADSKLGEKGPEYFFETFKEGTSAKSPRDLFKTIRIPNDYNFILNQLNEFRK